MVPDSLCANTTASGISTERHAKPYSDQPNEHLRVLGSPLAPITSTAANGSQSAGVHDSLQAPSDISSTMTSHDGLHALVTASTRRLFHIRANPTRLELVAPSKHIQQTYGSLTHIAATSAGQVAAAFHLPPVDSGVSRVLQICMFASLPSFTQWYATSASTANPTIQPLAIHNIPEYLAPDASHLRQLLATNTSFIALTSSGTVYTWGDPRFPAALGRPVTGDAPAQEPAVVQDLAGLRVEKIVACAGGGMMGGITEGGDGWIWGVLSADVENLVDGGGGDSSERGIAALENVGEGEFIARVELPRKGPEEEREVVDMAIGDAHLVVLDAAGSVWVCGGNECGQLGIGSSARAKWQNDWCLVEGFEQCREEGKIVEGVFCGDLTSFVVVENGL